MKKMFFVGVLFFLFGSLSAQTKIKLGLAESVSASFDVNTKNVGSSQSLFGLSGIYTEKGFAILFANFSGENFGFFSGYQIKGPVSGYVVTNKSWLNRHGYYAAGAMYSMPITKDIGLGLFTEFGSSTQSFKPAIYSGFFLTITPTIWISR